MKKQLIPLLLLLLAATVLAADGVVLKTSRHTVAVTVDRLEEIVTGKGFTVVARVDHGAAAAGAGVVLRPTELLIFGNPAVGSRLMSSEQGAGLDLPVKVLVYEDGDGKVWMSYNDPRWLLARHGITDRGEVGEKMSQALGAFTDAAGGG